MIPQMTAYIDIGVNLTGSSFRHDLEDVVQRAVDAGVTRMIVTGTDLDHSRAALALNQRFPAVLSSTAGVHPHHAGAFDRDTTAQLGQICAEASVVAVGECGLDYNRNYSTPEEQRFAFEKQLQLAVELQLPVFLHQRDAHDDFVSMLREHSSGLVGAVAHCFTGSVDEALEYVAMGMHIGITGWICDERRGQALQRAVRSVPLDRIMLETDAPYLLPRDLGQEPVQKRRNEPCFLPHICKVTAGYMGIDHQQLAQSARANARRFFAI
jgi:TatD DNase family protein